MVFYSSIVEGRLRALKHVHYMLIDDGVVVPRLNCRQVSYVRRDQAAGESCPLFPGTPKTLHRSTPDPAKVTVSEAEIDVAFDKAFFLLKNRVEELMK